MATSTGDRNHYGEAWTKVIEELMAQEAAWSEHRQSNPAVIK